ncbi:hypothetical protein ONS95_012021 [Cadophora gregata]|uniref:uncharacterized protein n=1 Tax=Cadophora gregata TaxID=51156 RepID=UPI0026DD295B|nr:uncharacterized protein ONS95_012021 [Cadophora gregata]KAK0117692.1 hypothetical protein ONS95_012021 [Cadophora gregata]KAK0122741.1 hypothetical protein ONS96_009776 [Cadophora gregata f. sp. sojae]
MSTAIPQVPPRPTRTTQQDQSAGSGSSLGSDLPKIPPRPAHRRVDRSISPARESFARSPLNETPFLANHGNHSKSSLQSSESLSVSDLPRRPPSVTLPSLGQEGNEYAEFSNPSEEQLGSSPTQTRNIANDLKLHAPKPSLPVSSAKARVSTVTRTDSGQAAAYGIGKPSGDDKEPHTRSLKAKASFASQTSVGGTERPPSSAESDHGIPEIGQRVPMYPNAGDVQAPSPAPFAQPFAPGIGFHNDGSKPRHHGRKTSSRGHDIPPDAYGRYGHGVIPHDRFEKAYYEKHPELFKKELGQYGEGRPEWAMSSDDLNKIVRDTASRGAGSGSHNLIGTPSEQVGFQASEEYASRMSSPRPQSGYHVSHSNISDTHVDSPLRKESSAAESSNKAEFEKTLSRSLQAPSDTTLESEAEDDVIHVDNPGRRSSRIYGADYAESTEELERQISHGVDDEYSAPILASDEVAKEPFGYNLEPAVSPLNERRGYEDGAFHYRSGSASSANNSRPSSRPGSIHGVMPGLRLPGAHLEDLDEYEPLFPEEEKSAAGKEKPLTAADRLKRPELKNRKFPSQDIWEDTPNSLQYTATVSTPQLPEEEEAESKDSPEEVNSAHAFARRQEELAERESRPQDSFLHQEKKPWAHKPHLAAETRPNPKQRFPSRDIWEDTPDSLQLQTTVASPQVEDKDITSPPDEQPVTSPVNIAAVAKPQIPARPNKSKLSESPETAQPAIPERPRPKQVDATSPPVPVKAKPHVPARPAKPITRESTENVPLTTTPSNSSAKSVGSDQGAAAAAKPKPPVPSRPLGSKIAALQGGFMADLNKRLQLGAQAPKKEEPAPEEEEVKEKAPLVDARKGRARGPARRAPAKSPAPAAAVSETTSTLAFSMPATLWQIDPDEDYVFVASYEEPAVSGSLDTKAAESETPTLATNTAGIPVHEPAEIAPEAENASAPQSAIEDYHASQAEETEKALLIAQAKESSSEVQPVKGSDEPPVVQESETKAPLAAPEDEDLSASTATLKPSEKEGLEKEPVKEIVE